MIGFRSVLGRYEADEFNQQEAAELLGVSERTFRRWCQRFEGGGEAGLLDRRLGKASGKRVPLDREQKVETLYRTRYSGFTARHFHDYITQCFYIDGTLTEYFFSYGAVEELTIGDDIVARATEMEREAYQHAARILTMSRATMRNLIEVWRLPRSCDAGIARSEHRQLCRACAIATHRVGGETNPRRAEYAAIWSTPRYASARPTWVGRLRSTGPPTSGVRK